MTKFGEIDHLERVALACTFQEPDYVPVGWECWNPAHFYGPEDWLMMGKDGKKIAKIKIWQHNEFNIDYLYPQVHFYQTLSAWGTDIKRFADFYPSCGSSINPDEPWFKGIKVDPFDIETVEAFVDELEVPDPYEAEETKAMIEAIEIMKKETDAVVGGFGLDAPSEAFFLLSMHASFSILTTQRGIEAFRRLLEKTTEWAHAWMESQINAGANFIGVGAAPTIGAAANPELAKFEFQVACEYLKRHSDFCGKHGVPLASHVCRNSTYIIPRLAELAERTGLINVSLSDYSDPVTAKKYAQGKITIATGPDPTTIICYGNPRTIERAVKYYMRVAPGGGFILHIRDGVLSHTPLENVRAFVKAGRKWGKYPIAKELELIDPYSL